MRWVLTTCPAKNSKKLSNEILKLKLAGCALNICLCDSKFWWKGKIDRAKENLIIFKTRDDLVEKLFKKIKELHPYKIPFIGEIEIKKVNEEYEKWLKEVTK
jgi:periplasmic divalent cation tolerance protein